MVIGAGGGSRNFFKVDHLKLHVEPPLIGAGVFKDRDTSNMNSEKNKTLFDKFSKGSLEKKLREAGVWIIDQTKKAPKSTGNLKLLSESVRLAAERAMAATAGNSKAVLSICVANTSTNEIVHAVQESCEEKWDGIQIVEPSGTRYDIIGLGVNEMNHEVDAITVSDIEKHMYMAVATYPDILIRSFGLPKELCSFGGERKLYEFHRLTQTVQILDHVVADLVLMMVILFHNSYSQQHQTRVWTKFTPIALLVHGMLRCHGIWLTLRCHVDPQFN